MANMSAAEKAIRRNTRRRAINVSRMSRIRTFIKKVEAAILGGDKAAAQAAYKAMQPELQRGVSKGLLHKNTVARKQSRLSSRIKQMA